MKVLVFGGTGFIGRNLCESLVLQGHGVRAFSLKPKSGRWPDIEGVAWTEGDFTCQSDVCEALHDVDVVFHLVSTTLPHTSNENPVKDLQDNVESTLRMMDCIVRMKERPKIIFVSSGGTVYGIPKLIPIPEDHPTDPICAYGVGKLAIEKYLYLYNKLHGLDYRILRLANPYGEHQPLFSGQGVIPVFLRKALSGEDLEIWGDGTVVRDYIYIGDAISAVSMVLKYEGDERIFNIGSGNGFSINDIIGFIETILERKISCRYFPSRVFDVPSNVLDIRRAQAHFGWKPQISLLDGLGRMADYVKKSLAS